MHKKSKNFFRLDIISKCIFYIVICSGIIRGELAVLHISDIDLENNIINIKRSVIFDKYQKMLVEKKPKTIKSVRSIPVQEFCTSVIKEYLSYRNELIKKFKSVHDNLFLNIHGGIIHVETPSKKRSKYIDRSKLKHITLHGLRHSYCSMQMNENDKLSAVDVAKLMGRTSYLFGMILKKIKISVFNKL